jgi:hypothetical protein
MSAATALGTGVAFADTDDDDFVADVRQNLQHSELADQQLIRIGNSVCGVLYGTMTTNPFATYPGSTLSRRDAQTVALAAVYHYCPSAVSGQSSDGAYRPDDGTPGTDSWVMNEMAKVNERNLNTTSGW